MFSVIFSARLVFISLKFRFVGKFFFFLYLFFFSDESAWIGIISKENTEGCVENFCSEKKDRRCFAPRSSNKGLNLDPKIFSALPPRNEFSFSRNWLTTSLCASSPPFSISGSDPHLVRSAFNSAPGPESGFGMQIRLLRKLKFSLLV